MEEEEEEEEEKEEEEDDDDDDEGFWDVTPCTAGTDVSKESTVSIFKIEDSSVTTLHCFKILVYEHPYLPKSVLFLI